MTHIDQQYWATDITIITKNSHSPQSTPNTPFSVAEIEAMLKPFFIGLVR